MLIVLLRKCLLCTFIFWKQITVWEDGTITRIHKDSDFYNKLSDAFLTLHLYIISACLFSVCVFACFLFSLYVLFVLQTAQVYLPPIAGLAAPWGAEIYTSVSPIPANPVPPPPPCMYNQTVTLVTWRYLVIIAGARLGIRIRFR